MSFVTPWMLLGLVLVPVLVAAYIVAQQRRRRYAVRFSNLDLLANVVTGSPGWRRHLPVALMLAAVTSLVVAMARPERDVRKPKRQATVMLSTDTSGSMMATDVEPDRLHAAQNAIRSMAKNLPENFRMGLVSFSSTAEIRLSPTTDRDALVPALGSLQASGGTAMGQGLQTALDAVLFGARTQEKSDAAQDNRKPAAVIVLLSDGKNTSGVDPLEVAQKAKDAGVPINTVALGTQSGTITLTGPAGVQQEVRVPPDPETLKQIAQITGGRFFAAPDASALESIYQGLGARIGFVTETQEITALFAGLGLVLLLVGGTLSLVWFGRLP